MTVSVVLQRAFRESTYYIVMVFGVAPLLAICFFLERSCEIPLQRLFPVSIMRRSISCCQVENEIENKMG